MRPIALLTVSLAAGAGCGGANSVAPRSTRPPDVTPPPSVTPYTTYLRAKGYTADATLNIELARAGPAVVVHSICTGSADGHCQAVDVFLLGSNRDIWHREYTGVLNMSRRPNGYSVRAVSYARQDPLCCPSLPAVTDNYTWTGSSFKEIGPLPRSPGL